MGQLANELELECVVIRTTGVGYESREIKIRIREQYLGRLQKPPSGRADIRCRQGLMLPQRLFDRRIPLQRIR